MANKRGRRQEDLDRNASPVGWYVASYQLRFTEVDDPERDDLDTEFLVWENTILVRAADFDQAYEKAVRVATDASEPYKGGPDGIDVQWVFEGVTELLPIYEEIDDGSEIMWSERKEKPFARSGSAHAASQSSPNSLPRTESPVRNPLLLLERNEPLSRTST